MRTAEEKYAFRERPRGAIVDKDVLIKMDENIQAIKDVAQELKEMSGYIHPDECELKPIFTIVTLIAESN